MGDLGQLEGAIRRIQKELDAKEIAETDRFRTVMTAFVKESSDQLADLKGRFEKVVAQFDAMLVLYDEVPSEMEHKHDFWTMMYDFATSLSRAHEKITNQEKAEAKKELQRQRKIEEAKARTDRRQ